MIKILWIEDDEAQVNVWRDAIAKAFSVVSVFKNHLDALNYAKSHTHRIEAVLTDLRILSGPAQNFYPPTNTAFVYGLKLTQDLSVECPTLPVIVYSRFLDVGSPTRIAVDKLLLEPPANLLNIYQTPIDPERAVRNMLYSYLKYDFSSKTISLAEYTRANPPKIIAL